MATDSCPRCSHLDAARLWAADKLLRMLRLSPTLDVYDRATIRAVAEALGDGNSRLRRPRKKKGQPA